MAKRKGKKGLNVAVVGEVYVMVLEGKTEAEILAAFDGRALSPAVMTAVRENLEAAGKTGRGALLGFCLEAQRHMYAKLVAGKEYAEAVKALKEIRVLAQMLPEGNGAAKPKLIDIERL